MVMLSTQRLDIRPLEPTDWQQMQTLFADFMASPLAPYDHPLPTDAPRVKTLTQSLAQSGLYYGVFLKGTPKLIGHVCFHPQEDSRDLGYCFHSSAHGKGYAFEAVSALIEELVRSQGVCHFTAGTALDNKPSCNLLRRLGFVLTAQETVCMDGKHPFLGGQFLLELPPTKTNI